MFNFLQELGSVCHRLGSKFLYLNKNEINKIKLGRTTGMMIKQDAIPLYFYGSRRHQKTLVCNYLMTSSIKFIPHLFAISDGHARVYQN